MKKARDMLILTGDTQRFSEASIYVKLNVSTSLRRNEVQGYHGNPSRFFRWVR